MTLTFLWHEVVNYRKVCREVLCVMFYRSQVVFNCHPVGLLKNLAL